MLRAREIDPKSLIIEVTNQLLLLVSFIPHGDFWTSSSLHNFCFLENHNYDIGFRFIIIFLFALNFLFWQAYEKGLMIAVIPFTSKV